MATGNDTSPQPGDDEVLYEHRMSDADALMWNIEKDPMLRSTITTVVFLEGEVGHKELTAAFDRASRAIPRLRQRVRGNPFSLAPPRWEVDPHFDLDYHMRFVRSPGDGSRHDVLHLAEPIAMQGFDRARPLWECTYVTGGDGGTSALILKIHHSVTDGVGGVRLMLELFDLEAQPEPRAEPPEPEVHVFNPAERFADAFVHQTRFGTSMFRGLANEAMDMARGVISDPVGSYEATGQMAESLARLLSPAGKPLSPIMTGRSLSTHFEMLALPLGGMKAAGHAVGGKLNDAFVAGILLGFRIYHEHHGAAMGTLRMGMPINVRSESDSPVAGNSWVPARFQIPVETDDPRRLLEDTRRCLQQVVHEPAYALVDPLSNIINRFPATMTTQFFGSMMRSLDFQASNVPGSPFPLWLLGHPVDAVVAFGPMAGAGANITLMSYRDVLNIGVNVDPAAVTDPSLFLESLREAFDRIMAVGRG